jgi:hypothetical protein
MRKEARTGEGRPNPTRRGRKGLLEDRKGCADRRCAEQALRSLRAGYC